MSPGKSETPHAPGPSRAVDAGPDLAPKNQCPLETLALDLGTVCGWAILEAGGALRSGSLELATDAQLEQQRRLGGERTGDVRFERLYRFLEAAIDGGVKRIVFEDVGFVKTRMQGQLWAGLRSAIWAVALAHPVLKVHCVSSVTLKHFATGNGCATKEAMAQALAKRAPQSYQVGANGLIGKPGGAPADHNEVDALWLAFYAATVDRGERSFLAPHQRKQEIAQARRQRLARRRLEARARKARTEARRKNLRAAIRALGRCCGAYRVQRNRWAVCLRCGSSLPLPHLTSTSNPMD